MQPTPRRGDRGAVLPMVALVMTALITFASLAIDIGFGRVVRRDMQALADVVALDLARHLDGRTEAVILADPAFTAAKAASEQRNEGELAGRSYATAVALGTTDSSGNFVDTASTTVPTAVRVTATGVLDWFFRPGSKSVSRIAVATIDDNELARFRVGSSLVSVNPQASSFLGQLLNSIVPGASVLSYQGLANANVSLANLGVPLGIPLTTASPDELLNTNVGLNDLMIATATALTNQGDTAAATALNNAIALGVPNTAINLGQALGAQSGAGGPGLGSYVSVAQLVATSVFLADSSHFITIPQSTVNIPGIGSVGFQLTGIEAPQEGGNTEADTATTQQVNLQLVPQILIDTATTAQQICTYPSGQQTLINTLLGGVLNLLGCALGTVPAQSLSVRVTATPTLDLRLAEVTVSQDIDCVNRRVTLSPTPASVRLQTVVDIDIDAVLGGVVIPILRHHIPASAVATGTATPQVFNAVPPGTPLATGTLYTQFTPATAHVGANPLGLANLLQVGPSSLQLLNVNLPTLANVVSTVVQPLLNNLLGQLDTLVIQPISQLLGLNFGGSDLTQLWLQCDESAVRLSS